MGIGNRRWSIVVIGVVVLLAMAAAVSASSPPGAEDASTRGIDADTVDGHHAAAASASTSQRADRVLWANSRGKLSKKSLPKAWLDDRYVNTNEVETIEASLGGNILTVTNTGAGSGVFGVAGSGGDGVVGKAYHSTKSGVYGFHDGSGYGITGRSASGFGVFAWGGGDSSGYDAVGDLLLQGTRGEIFSAGNYLNVYSNWNVNVSLDEDDNDSNGAFRIWTGGDSEIFRVEEDGDMWASGTKSALIDTETHGRRLVYAVESTGVWIEDFGTGALVDGAAEIQIGPIFAETVDLGAAYHVFVTPLGDCNGLYVTAKTPTSFEVRELGGGTASVEFDYRITARRVGYEQVRLEDAGAASAADGLDGSM